MEGTIQHSLPPPHPYPWLLYLNGKGAEDTQNFCTISDLTKTNSIRLPELGAATMWTRQAGWYLPETPTKLFLWNRFNFTKIELPPFKYNHISICDCILISSSLTAIQQVCSIFLFSDSPSTSIFYWYVGDEQWTQVDYREQLMTAPAIEGEQFRENRICLWNPFCINGCLYAKSVFEPCLLVEIKKLEPSGLKINSSHIFVPRIPLTSLGLISRMLESNKELFQIEISHSKGKVIAVVVHKLDFPTRVWHKVESIKDKVFYISEADSSFVCQAINPETEGGRVYVILEKNNFVYSYNMEDKSLMISQPFLNLPEEQSHSVWFMSDLRITGSVKEDIGKTQTREKESGDEIHSKEIEDTITYDEFALPLDRVDIVEAIAKRINIGIDYLHFRATNRFFHSSTPPIQWRSSSTASISRFDNISVSPLFVYFEKDNVLTFVHPMDGLKYKYNINLSMDLQPCCEICYSKDGWLLMVVNKKSSFFFNPFAKEQEKRPLPNAPETKNLNTWCMAFSHPPTSSECAVVELQWNPSLEPTPQENPEVWVSITCPGGKEWDMFEYEDFNFSFYNVSCVFHKGAFFYLNEEGKLAVLKVKKEEEEVDVGLDELDKLHAPIPCTDYYNHFLVECNDNLLSVFEGHFGKWVRIFKLNESIMTWIEVENLGSHMLFVGHTTFSTVASVSGMENKIYFPKFYRGNIVFYSLETKNYHTFESNEVVSFHCMEEKVNSCWIEPRS